MTDLPEIHVPEQRTQECCCETYVGNYDGPARECRTHGEPDVMVAELKAKLADLNDGEQAT